MSTAYALPETLVRPSSTTPRWPLPGEVAVVSPGGNTTALISDCFRNEDRAFLNRRLIDALDAHLGTPRVEQCGFLGRPFDSRSIARLEMFGGEFCGNATRSAVWYVTGGNDHAGLIEAAGVHRPLRFRVVDGVVSLDMPLLRTPGSVRSTPCGTWVQLDGIVHLVVTDPLARRRRSPRERLAALLRRDALDLRSQPAVGMTYFDAGSSLAEFCVWVRDVDTMFDETACGSGTGAIGLAHAAATRCRTDLVVTQPSGHTIEVQVDIEGSRPVRCAISGGVRTLYEGEVVF